MSQCTYSIGGRRADDEIDGAFRSTETNEREVSVCFTLPKTISAMASVYPIPSSWGGASPGCMLLAAEKVFGELAVVVAPFAPAEALASV